MPRESVYFRDNRVDPGLEADWNRPLSREKVLRAVRKDVFKIFSVVFWYKV